MKNAFTFGIALTVLLASVLGCSFVLPSSENTANTGKSNANKTLTDKAVDTAVGEQKIGVPECDEVIDMLSEYANNPDDNFVVKATKAVIVNKVREAIKQTVEENKTDKVEMAKNCKEIKAELEKQKSQDANKKAQ